MGSSCRRLADVLPVKVLNVGIYSTALSFDRYTTGRALPILKIQTGIRQCQMYHDFWEEEMLNKSGQATWSIIVARVVNATLSE